MYTEELSQGGKYGILTTAPTFTYRFIESLQKKILLTGSPQDDWSPVADFDRPALVRLWIAQAYAHGAIFMVPIQQWAPLSPQGWYDPDYDEFDYLYEFIHENATLFDDYTLQSHSSFLLPYNGLRHGRNNSIKTNLFLIENNIPYNIIAAGDDWWDNELKDEDFIRAAAILVNSDTSYLDSTQTAFVANYADKVVTYNDLTSLFELVPRQFDVSTGNEKVTVVPRENLQDPEAPYICHLINRMYDKNANAIMPQDFSVTVDTSLYEKKIGGALLFRPGMDSLELVLYSAEKGFRMDISNLEEWGIVQFEYGEPDYNTGIDTQKASHKLSIYPNPASGFINMEIDQPSTISIYDINGMQSLISQCEPGPCRINISSLSSGFYIIKVNTGDTILTGKFIVRH